MPDFVGEATTRVQPGPRGRTQNPSLNGRSADVTLSENMGNGLWFDGLLWEIQCSPKRKFTSPVVNEENKAKLFQVGGKSLVLNLIKFGGRNVLNEVQLLYMVVVFLNVLTAHNKKLVTLGQVLRFREVQNRTVQWPSLSCSVL